MNDVSVATRGRIAGQEHWTNKGDAKLFLWEKRAPGGPKNGTVLFVHGSSMASQPVFDLQVPGRPNSSAMEYFAERGFDTWCLDHRGLWPLHQGPRRSTPPSPRAPTTSRPAATTS